MENAPRERRNFPRIETELFVRYRVLTAPQQTSRGTTKNIGGGGVCLVTHEQFLPETTLAVEIKFPQSHKPVVAICRTIWSGMSKLGPGPGGNQQFDNGVEFTQISDVDRAQIVNHVKSELEKTKLSEWKIGIVRNLSK